MGPPETRVRVEVRVSLKPGVMDAEAASVERSLALLAIRPAPHVATARVYDLDFEGVSAESAERLAREAVDRLLANPVVHHVEMRTVLG